MNEYRMPDNQIVTVVLPVRLVRRMARSWRMMPGADVRAVRNAMRHALWDEWSDRSENNQNGSGNAVVTVNRNDHA